METSLIIENAVKAKGAVALADEKTKNAAILNMADALEQDADKILAANRLDLDAARGKISDVMLDRLTLTAERISAMASSLRDVTRLPDPVGKTISSYTAPNGLLINKVSVPFGVIAVIFESRPNVTSDAAALCLKSGNACILRGGKEAINSNTAITSALRRGVSAAGLPEDTVSIVTDTSRDSATELMTATGKIDLLIPRGGKGLIKACVDNAKVPCIETGTGICHIYVDAAADIEKAVNIIVNAKASRPSVCNAAEVLLVHKDAAELLLPLLYEKAVTERKENGQIPVEFRCSERANGIIPSVKASETDFDTEFLDYIMAVDIVDSVEDAINHIAIHSTHHSEAIITEDTAAAEKFTLAVDSAAVYVNASTRFTDGGEFGFGCEIGISTQKMHARGPMGLCEMTTYKYVVRGNGQIR